MIHENCTHSPDYKVCEACERGELLSGSNPILTAEEELIKLKNFVGKKPFISTGYFQTERGEEWQITLHSLKGSKYTLWEKLKLIRLFISKI